MPRHEYKNQPDDALTVAEFIDYLDKLAAIHEDTAKDFSAPTFSFDDTARIFRQLIKRLRGQA